MRALGVHGNEAAPDGLVCDQRLSLERLSEDLFHQVLALIIGHGAQAKPAQGAGIEFRNESAHLIAVRIVMRDEVPAGVSAEIQRRRVESRARAVPREPVGQLLGAQAEIASFGGSHDGVDAIGADHEIRLRYGLHTRGELQLDADLLAELTQDGEQCETADCAAVARAVDEDCLVAVVDQLVLVAVHPARELAIGLRVRLLEPLESAIGEHHAETESRIRGILLDHLQPARRARFLQQIGQVQARRAGAHDARVQGLHGSMILSVSRSNWAMRPCIPPESELYQTAGLSPSALRDSTSSPSRAMT